MLNSNVICTIVILCFGFIQAIEISSFFARYSGIYLGKKTLAYTLQNAVFMLTRFFTMALLPLLGLLIDLKIHANKYLYMVISAFALASIFSLSIIFFNSRVIQGFMEVLKCISLGRSLFNSLMKLPYFILIYPKNNQENISIPRFSNIIRSKIFILSAIVFSVYALSVFLVFFISLSYPAYRASISQLSGVTNAIATVLLTFAIEPKISLAIDSNEKSEALNMLWYLIIGRIIGVGIISQLVVIGILLLC